MTNFEVFLYDRFWGTIWPSLWGTFDVKFDVTVFCHSSPLLSNFSMLPFRCPCFFFLMFSYSISPSFPHHRYLLINFDFDFPDSMASRTRSWDGEVDGDSVVLRVRFAVEVGFDDERLVAVEEELLLKVDVGTGRQLLRCSLIQTEWHLYRKKKSSNHLPYISVSQSLLRGPLVVRKISQVVRKSL